MIDEPKSGAPVNKLWAIVAKCAQALNALFAITVKVSTTNLQPEGKLIWADANAVLELKVPNGGSITVTDGTTTLANITTLSFDGAFFTVSDGGTGIANITPQTERCP